MKKFFEEFKAFALKGNMMDMAIGVLIGGGMTAASPQAHTGARCGLAAFLGGGML